MSHKNLDTLIAKINEELEKVTIWLQLHKLSLNLTKITLCYLNHQGKN